MTLILQAIKSLFRGVSSAIEQTATALSKRIDGVQSTADTAKKNAAKAQVAAREAKVTAEAAKSAAEGHSDWNESDPTSPAYVENRTHYTENYMRELEPVEYGPVRSGGLGFVYIGELNPDLAQALERGIEGITVEYRFSSDAPWEEARSSVYTVSATDVRYYFRDQSGTYIFYYHKLNATFYNNFATSKDNLYIRVSGEVPEVRYVPLDVRFLPDDTRTFHAWQYAGECNGNLTPVTVGAFSEMWICGAIAANGSDSLKLKINNVDLDVVGRTQSEGDVDIHIAVVPLDDDSCLIVSRYFCNEQWLAGNEFQLVTIRRLSTKVVFNASNWMTETNTVTLSTYAEIRQGTLIRVFIR